MQNDLLCATFVVYTPSVDHCDFDVLHCKSVLQRVQHGRRHAFPLLSLVIFFSSFHIFHCNSFYPDMYRYYSEFLNL